MYIGKQPQIGNYQTCDSITATATDTFNLTVGNVAVSPISAHHCLVSLNGILQAPISSYTISGSTIVFASALTTSDSIDFITILGHTLDTGTPSDGTVTNAKLAQDVISGETALTAPPATTDEFLVSDAGTLKRIDFSLMGNGPAWRATMSTAQTNNSSNTAVLVAFDTEVYDTDSAYTNTSTNYKFTVPSGQAGKYFIGANINVGDYQDNANFQQKLCYIFKNGSQVAQGRDQFSTAEIQGDTNNYIGAFTVQNLSEGDYIQVYGQVYNTAFDLQTSVAEFYGFKLIGV